jgi:hypothetical protein
MARRSWDDPWQRYAPSVPLPAQDGIATSKQRGPMAATWWSRRFTEVLESFGLGARMQRGRRYARTGQVLSLQVSSGVIAAQVQGSRRTPYLVTVSLTDPGDEQWQRIIDTMKAKVGFVARLLDGEVPPDLEEVFSSCGVVLFPKAWKDLRAACSCPDWENPCKHIAAVLYVFADQLDADAWLALELRGRSRETLLEALTSAGREPRGGIVDEVAPWWPFPAGPLPALAEMGPLAAAVTPDRPDGVLDSLEPLEVDVGASLFADLVRPLYERIVEAT